MYSYGPPHMAVQKQDDQLELTYSNNVRTHDVTLKTCRRRWMIGISGERGSGISVLAARHDDDDDDVTLCWWSAKQTIPLSVLARNKTKCLDSSLDVAGSRKGTPVRGVGQRDGEEGVGEAWREWPVDTGSQKWPVGMRECPDQRVKSGQDRLAFLVALWKFR